LRQGYGRIIYTDSRKNKTRIEEYRSIRLALLDIADVHRGFWWEKLKINHMEDVRVDASH